MASGRDEVLATATAVETDMKTVLVTCLVDGLQVTGVLSKKAKNSTVSVKFAECGFDMEVIVKGKSRETVFRKRVKKLPGPINPDACTWKVDKGKVLISLVKAQEGSWAVQLSQRGLEQDESDD